MIAEIECVESEKESRRGGKGTPEANEPPEYSKIQC